MKQEPTVVAATVREATSSAGDELHIECRMSDGQKGAFVVVDAEFPSLAQQIAASLDPKAQAERDAQLIELLGADLSADLRVQFQMMAEDLRNGEWSPWTARSEGSEA